MRRVSRLLIVVAAVASIAAVPVGGADLPPDRCAEPADGAVEPDLDAETDETDEPSPWLYPERVYGEEHHAEATRLEQILPTSLYFCQALSALFSDATRTTVVGFSDLGDSSLYTGDLVATESFRYRVMKRLAEDESVPPGHRKRAEEERDEAKARIDGMLDRLHFNIHISKGWHGSGEPYVNTAPEGRPDEILVSTGGVPFFEEGYPMRFCLPADAPLTPDDSHQRRFSIDDDEGRTWVCEAGTSRDTYTGYFFGLMTAFDLVGPDDADLQALIRDDVLLMYEFIRKYAYGSPRPTGNLTVNPDSFDGSYSLLFTYQPFERVWLAQAARHVAAIAGTPEQQALYEATFIEEWETFHQEIPLSWSVNTSSPYGDAIATNLTNLGLYHTLSSLLDPRTTTADDQARAQFLVTSYQEIDRWTSDDDNGWFDTLAAVIWNDGAREARGAGLLGDWIDYRHNWETGRRFGINPARCELPAGDPQHVDCVHEDRIVKTDPLGNEIVVFEGTGPWVTAEPRPVAQRRPEEFLWQRWGGLLQTRDYTRLQNTGVDFLMPYWMTRYHDEVVGRMGLQAPSPGLLSPDVA